MSIEGDILGAGTVAGGGAGAVSALVSTGNPAVVGIIAGVAMIVVLGIIARATQRG